jgi:hypothetical protein
MPCSFDPSATLFKAAYSGPQSWGPLVPPKCCFRRISITKPLNYRSSKTSPNEPKPAAQHSGVVLREPENARSLFCYYLFILFFLIISLPRRPNPVTSVAAVAPACRRISAEALLDCSMEAIAVSTCMPAHCPRMSAANRAPVPRALVSSRLSPGRIPPLRSSLASSMQPWIWR